MLTDGNVSISLSVYLLRLDLKSSNHIWQAAEFVLAISITAVLEISATKTSNLSTSLTSIVIKLIPYYFHPLLSLLFFVLKAEALLFFKGIDLPNAFFNHIQHDTFLVLLKSHLCYKAILCHKIALDVQLMNFFLFEEKMFCSQDI